jgi:hypothetical protein
MISRRAGLAGMFVVAGAIGAIVTVAGSPPGDPARVVLVPAFVVPSLVGGLILVRRPENPIGWLFCLIGFGLAATMGIATVTEAAAAEPFPAWVPLVGWAAPWLFLLFVVPAVLVMLTFPTGRLPSRRWRPVVTAVVISAIASGIGAAFGREQLEISDGISILNPLVAPEPIRSWLLTARDVGDVASLVLLVPSAAAVATRMRRAVGVERLQLKWFAYAVAMLAIVLPASTLVPSSTGLQWALAVLGFGAALPLAAGIAILRYRLYDIDVVIRRTLVYGGVVAVLGATYVVLVLALQAPLRGLTGGERIPVALSTLTIAALFGPVRSRIREAVDRRFYRASYDAQRILESFTAQLRDEVSLLSVSAALTETAGRAVQPTSAGIWIRSRPT